MNPSDPRYGLGQNVNINANTVRKIGYATTGAAAGGGTGAAVAQAWDPKESIVKEVARGAAQGAFGEILGFGLAGGLSKMYNKKFFMNCPYRMKKVE